MRRLALLVALAALAPAARADDAEAARLIREATDRWNDPTPDECVRLAERALAAPPSTALMTANVHLFLGRLHQVKTGRLDAAIASYDQVEALLQDDPARGARALRAQALVGKANIIYAEKDDHEAALELYRRAQEAHPLASTADTASQLCYRVGRGARTDEERARWLELALTLAREALDLGSQPPGEASGERRPPRRDQGARKSPHLAARAKFGVQLALVLEALGREDEAATAFAEVQAADLDENAHYPLALLHAVRGDLERAGAELKLALSRRPTALTRNQLRRFLRAEPDFARGLEREDWREVVVDEPP